ncbi:MAG TPA: hypothetical protein GXZ38_00120 [Spirochaetales bacterium]|jgi:hypothetical protein|nr:hypothetical protein [Spirochaetales bacterium]
MSSLRIPAKQISQLSSTVKDLINEGIWFLYEAKNDKGTFNLGTTYILITDKDAYMLDNEGGILSVDLKTNVSKNLGPSVYFSDIPFPKSLSNIVLT